jgi:hypothetical protein
MPDEMRYYPLTGDQWGLFVDGTELVFDTIVEVMRSMSKITFASQAQSAAARLAAVIDDLESLSSVYYDRGYDSGGADAIADADVEALGLAAAELTAFVTMADQLTNFRDNLAVTTGDYGATINQVRDDV